MLTDIFSTIASALKELIALAGTLVIPTLEFLFGLGQAALTRLLIVVALTAALYKPSRKLAGSIIGFIISITVSILTMRFLPESLLQISALHLIFGGIIILFTFVFRFAWWVRRFLLIAAMIVCAALWWF